MFVFATRGKSLCYLWICHGFCHGLNRWQIHFCHGRGPLHYPNRRGRRVGRRPGFEDGGRVFFGP